MKFGYFFMGLALNDSSLAHVQVRPMDPALQLAGLRIDIRIPLRTQDGGLSVSALAQSALASAMQLLPESALAAWSLAMAGQAMIQPAMPAGAMDKWNAQPEF